MRPPISHLQSMRLELVSSHDTGYQCLSVAHYGKKVVVAQHNGDIFMAHLQKESVNVLQYSNTATDQLFSFPRETNNANFLSAHTIFVSVINCDKKQLEIYNQKSGILTGVKLFADTDKVYNNCFTSDGGLLVVSLTTKHQLTRYTVDNRSDKASLTKQWSVDVGEWAFGIAESENGLIFLCGTKSKKINVYDSAGKSANTGQVGIK